MCIFLGFPESARKQHFHLDGTKRSRETETTGKRANGFHTFKKKHKTIFVKGLRKARQYSRMKDNVLALLSPFVQKQKSLVTWMSFRLGIKITEALPCNMEILNILLLANSLVLNE